MKNYKILLEPFSLTAYFRSILNINNSFEVFNFLLKKSGLSLNELKTRWDSFDKIFGEEYGKIISSLSFATIIEARGLLLNKILSEEDINTLVIELASGFTPRGLNLIKK